MGPGVTFSIPGGGSGGTGPEEPGGKPPTLLHAGVFWVPLGSVGIAIIVGFQFYYLCLKASFLKLLILARCYFIPSDYFVCFSSPDTDI